MNLFKLFILGDIGFLNTILKNSLNIVKSRMNFNDKVVLLGDNFYFYGVDSLNDNLWNKYNDIFKEIPKDNVYSILGNHDYHKNASCQINNIYWNNPNYYYKLELNKDIDLYFLNTVSLYPNHALITNEIIERNHNNRIINIINEQLSWFKYELKKDKNKRKIVFGHYPILTNGFYYDMMKPLYNLLYPIFKKYKVDAYISGHEHNIQYINYTKNNYRLNQFICGSSSDKRIDEYCYNYHTDMYNNNDNFIMELSIIYNNKVLIKFIDSNNEIKYSYII